MAKESDARIERLKKASQESREQMTKMMELIRILIKDKRQASARIPRTKQLKERKSLYIRQGLLPHMPQISTWHKPH